jgi:hypothetical protein
MKKHIFIFFLYLILFHLFGCLSSLEVEDLIEIDPQSTMIKMDFKHKPLPDIPLPNDIATRYDPHSATKRRVNASMIAPTLLESQIRANVDQIDGWGVNQPITIPFTKALDLDRIIQAHHQAINDLSDDLVYLMNLSKARKGELEFVPLDIGNGNFPVLLEEYGDHGEYGSSDPRGWTNSLLYEEANEDLNENGKLDEGEDIDGDGHLDQANYLDPLTMIDPSSLQEENTRIERAKQMIDFYERETNTLIIKPLIPLNERSEYAVIVTKRLLDENGNPVRSPFQSIIHQSQKHALPLIKSVLSNDLKFEDIAFVFTYTTQSLQSHWIAVREGLYGHGIQKHLAEAYPAEIEEIYTLKDLTHPDFQESKQAKVLYHEELFKNFSSILDLVGGTLDKESYQFKQLKESIGYIDYHIFGRFKSPQLFPRKYRDLPEKNISCETLCSHQMQCQSQTQANALESTQAQKDQLKNRCFLKCLQDEEEWQINNQTKQDEIKALDLQISDANDQQKGELVRKKTDLLAQVRHLPAQRQCMLDRCQAFEVCEDLDPFLPYDQQIWPNDLDSKTANARGEDIYFWLTIPRKEVAQLKEGEVFPVVMVGHGYTLHKLDAMMGFAGQLAKKGNATIAIDCVSHGLAFPENYKKLGRGLAKQFGLENIIDPLIFGRAHDLNRDGLLDSGADFWTSYLFHTRDQVRQCTLDYMQLVRILRSFTGQKWAFDMNGDGKTNDLAGDFNGDGKIDIGGKDGVIGITGTSLGGIMAGIVAGLEPGIDVSVPIAGGGVLSDIGVRSLQGGVKEAVIYRLMAPIYTAQLQGESLEVSTIVPDLNQSQKLSLFKVDQVKIGDTIQAINLRNQETRCMQISDQVPFEEKLKDQTVSGFTRLSLQSDLHDLTEFKIYQGNALCVCSNTCESEKIPFKVINRLDETINFQGLSYEKNDRIKALAEGLGLERNHPRMRRFFHLSQLVLDGGDPATYAKHWLDEPLVYPNVKDQTQTHMIVVTTMGDMNVPANSSISMARAGGLIDWTQALKKYDQHPKYQGFTPNQLLIELQASLAIHNISPFKDNQGHLTHIDIENFSENGDIWNHLQIPRLDPPLRLGLDQKDSAGGVSGAIFPFIKPEGWHGFSFPGQEQDIRLKTCLNENQCDQKTDQEKITCTNECKNSVEQQFDLGNFMSAFLGNYMRNGGKSVKLDACISWGGCEPALPPPALRTLPIQIGD